LSIAAAGAFRRDDVPPRAVFTAAAQFLAAAELASLDAVPVRRLLLLLLLLKRRQQRRWLRAGCRSPLTPLPLPRLLCSFLDVSPVQI
jgi:hypothetical protein